MFVEGREREKERAEELDGGLEVSGGERKREGEAEELDGGLEVNLLLLKPFDLIILIDLLHHARY